MTDAEEPGEVDLDQQRKLVSNQRRALDRFYRSIAALKEKKTTTSVSLVALRDKNAELNTITRRAYRALDVLFDNEEEEDKMTEDETSKVEFDAQAEAALSMLHDMSSKKKAAMLAQSIDKDLQRVEDLMAVDDTQNHSASLPLIQTQVESFSTQLLESTIPDTDEIWGVLEKQKDRLHKIRVKTVAPATSTTIIKSKHNRDFDTPKVNIPKFKGELEAWHGFWSRFKAAVHDNTKLAEPVKMAILIDLVAEPGLHRYLIAANDGGDDRYKQAIAHLKSRFNRPRELRQIYCQQLADLPPIKGTPSDLNQVADTVFEAVEGIKRSGQTTIDSIATSLVAAVLPQTLRTEWETKTEETSGVPSIEAWLTFIRKKATNASQVQKTGLPVSSRPPKDSKKKHPIKSEGKVYTSQGEPANSGESEDSSSSRPRSKQPKTNGSGNKVQCNLCSAAHFIFQCKQFLDTAVQQRREHVLSSSLCFNCLRAGHAVKDCQCSYRCRLCKKAHNTLLHTDAGATPVTVNHVVPTAEELSASPTSAPQKERLLMTSQVFLTNSAGKQIEARGMLDSGASISVMSNKMMNQLKLKKADEWMNVSGVESSQNSPARPTTNVTVTSVLDPGWSSTVKVVILPKATVDLPRHDLTSVKQMPHLQNLQLADPFFHQPRRVDLILDSDIFDEVLLPMKITGPPETPSTWETKLGWRIMGRYTISQTVSPNTAAVNVTNADTSEENRLDTTLEKFWTVEQLPRSLPALSTQEVAVQRHFSETHYFSPTAGRYVVTLPKRATTLQLGESYQTAKVRFLRNEQALLRKGNWTQFQAVVQEYLTLGHAQKTTPQELCTPVERTYTSQCMLSTRLPPAAQS